MKSRVDGKTNASHLNPMVLIQAVAYSNVADANIYNRVGLENTRNVLCGIFTRQGMIACKNPHLSAKTAVVLEVY